MIVTCNDEAWIGVENIRDRTDGAPCGRTYDDFYRSRICPHPELPPPISFEELIALTKEHDVI